MQTDHHQRSQRRLRERDFVRELLQASLPEQIDLANGCSATFELIGVSFAGPFWVDLAVQPSLVFEVVADLQVYVRQPDGASEGYRLREALLGTLPALIDPASGDPKDLGPLEFPPVSLGSHRGAFVGRAKHPIAQLTWRPGFHFVDRRPGDHNERFGLVVADTGLSRWVSRSDAESVVRGDVSTPGAAALSGLGSLILGEHDVRSAPTLLPATLDRVHKLVGEESPADWLLRRFNETDPEAEIDPEEVLPVDEEEAPDRALTGLVDESVGMERLNESELLPWGGSRSLLRVRLWGDVLRETVAAAVHVAATGLAGLPASSGLASARDVATWVSRTSAGVVAQEARVLERGIPGRVAPLLIDAVYENTLAHVSQRQQLTRFGSGGLPHPLNGRIAFRELDSEFDGLVCPIHTPESEDSGLVRFFAAGSEIDPGDQGAWDARDLDGDVSHWRDLSAAGALIPYINHDDPARASISAKNLKQVVPMVRGEAALVRTPIEVCLAEQGVIRSPKDALATQRESGVLDLALGDEVDELHYGPPLPWPDGPAVDWVVIGRGESGSEEGPRRVGSGDVLAHARDVKLDDDGEPELAYGRNALVAFTPWKGLNYEDAVVISEPFAEAAAVAWVSTVVEDFSVGRDGKASREIDVRFIGRGDVVKAGDVLAEIHSAWPADPADPTSVVLRSVRAPIDGRVAEVRRDGVEGRLEFLIAHGRPLAVGDKIMNRHGGKGVVGRVLPECEMPLLKVPVGKDSDGVPRFEERPAEVLLNPLGVFRRLNVGQMLETHRSLAAVAEGQRFVVAPRRLGAEGLRDLGRSLDAIAPSGRLEARDPAGVIDLSDGLVGGWQYLVRLHHVADEKRSERGSARLAVRAEQPAGGSRQVSGRRLGSPQRLGEMEVWHLLAMGADAVLEDAFRERSSRRLAGPLRSVAVFLDAVGLELVIEFAGRESVRIDKWLDEIKDDAEDPAGGETTQFAVRLAATDEVGIARFSPIRVLERSGCGEPLEWSYLEDRTAQDWAAEGDPHWRVCPSREVPAEPGAAKAPHDCAERLVDLESWERSDDHGELVAPTCACGAETALGVQCERCFDVVVRRPDLSMSEVRYRIDLPAAIEILHPWFFEDRWVGERLVRRWRGDIAAEEGNPETDELFSKLLGDNNEQGLRSSRFRVRSVPLLPPSRLSGEFDPLRRRYQLLIRRIVRWHKDPNHRRALERSIRKDVAEIYGAPGDPPDSGSIAGVLGGKTGLLRRGLLGRQVAYSGRGVLVGSPELNPEEVALPAALFDRLRIEPVNDQDPWADVVLFNRTPTAQPNNLMAVRAVRGSTDAIEIPPLIMGGNQADFDGDTAAIHRPQSVEARRQAWERLRPARHQRSPRRSGSLSVKQDLDIALGLVRSDLATDTDVIGELFRSATEAAIGPDADLDAVAQKTGELQREGLAQATGWSGGVLDLLPFLAPDPEMPARFSIASDAGALKKFEQLTVRRGLLNGLHPRRLYDDVDSSFLEGLTTEEFRRSALGGLSTLSEKKLVSPLAGGLTKALTDIAYDVVIVEEQCEHPDSEPRTPLSCRSGGWNEDLDVPAGSSLCQACYGIEHHTGVHAPIGSRVGVLAAMLIGERGLEGTMKAGTAAGTQRSKLEDIRRLRSLLTSGTSAAEINRRIGHEHAEDSAVFVLAGEVDPRHVHVIGRGLLVALPARLARQRLGSVARRRGDPIIDAALLGSVDELLVALRVEAESPIKDRPADFRVGPRPTSRFDVMTEGF